MLNHFFQSLTVLKLSTWLMIFAWWIAPLWMYGVFDDGMFYSCIARNLVFDAQATIWDLKVSNALDSGFNGHPPMAFWIQSLFFWLLGDYYWIERVFSLLMALLTLLLIHKCWKLFNKEAANLALFFWMCVPIVGWSYANNMLENIFTVFTTAAIWLILRQALRNTHFVSTTFIAALLISGGTLVKGPVALYPLATGLIYALLYNRALLKRTIIGTILMTGLMGLAYWILFISSPRAQTFFDQYVELQLKGSLSGMDSLAEHRFFLVQSIVEELLIVLSIILGMRLLCLFFHVSIQKKINWRLTFLWLFIAFSASLPMLISPKQLRFYIVPSMVFYALSLATASIPLWVALANYFKDFLQSRKALKGGLIIGLFICLSLSIFNVKKYARSLDVLPDSMAIGTLIPNHTEAYLDPSLYTVWNLHAYMYRYFYIDLSTVYKNQDYVIMPKNQEFQRPEYKQVDLPLSSFKLYKRSQKE
jgi:4-amino-4-deoxy-L-arabinose transferase-like glycosyltransferase